MAESHRDEIAKLETLYASNPDGRVFTHLAEAYRRAGELDRAREILERGLHRHQDYASAHVVMGRVLTDQGLESDAIASFRRVLDLDPENLIARRALAESDRAAGRDADALVHYRELLAHDPSDEGVRQIISELDARSQPQQPAAPPPSAWSSTQAEESWEPIAQPPIFEGTFGGAPETPPEAPSQEPISLDSVAFGDPLDLSGVDFGGEPSPAPEASLSLADFGVGPADAEPPATPPTADQSCEPVAESDEHGWGDWPGTGAEQPSHEQPLVLDATPEEPEQPALEAAPAEPEPEPASDDAAQVPEQPALDAAPAEAEPEPASDDATQVPEQPALEAAPAEAEPASDDATQVPEHPPEAAPDGPESFASGVPADEPAHTDAEAATDPAGGVPTETLAALYLAQGFPDRAAVVYRALLAGRPDDAELEARARAAEAEAEALRGTRTGVDEARDVWVSGGADTWDADALAATAHAWGEQEIESEGAAGPSIAEYFQRILSWRSAAADAAAVTRATEPVETIGGAAEAELAEDVSIPEPSPQAGESLAAQDEMELAATGPFTFDGGSGEGDVTAQPETEPFPDEPLPEEPLPYMFEEEVAEPQPYVFETGAEEERRATPAEAEQPQEESAALAFEPPSTQEEPGSSTFEPPGTEEEPTPFTFEPVGVEEEEAMPFAFEAADGEEEEEAGEPLPFVFEPVDADEEEEEPLPFELDFAATADEDEPEVVRQVEAAEWPAEQPEAAAHEWQAAERPEEPELESPAPGPEPDYPWAAADQAVPEPEPWAESEAEAEPERSGTPSGEAELLVLDEAEAVPELPAQEVGWDPTIALADVAPARPRPPASRSMGPSRPAPAPAPPPAADEEEDEDLEMFRSWLQSLKR